MDNQPTYLPKATAIPRLSKLPLPRSQPNRTSSPLKTTLRPAPSIDHLYAKSAKDASFSRSVRGPMSLTPLHAAPIGSGCRRNAQGYRAAASQEPQRQPIGRLQHPHSKQEPCEQSEGVKGVDRSKEPRHVSQERTSLHLAISDGTDVCPTSPTTDFGTSHLQLPKQSRPSLSDRAVESLAHIPPSPATDRRRSSFFNPQSSMALAHPQSVIGPKPVSTINYGSVRTNGFARPTSPLKRPSTTTPSRRSVSSTLPSGSLTAIGTSVTKRSVSPTKPSERPVSSASHMRVPPNPKMGGKTSAARTKPAPPLHSVYQPQTPSTSDLDSAKVVKTEVLSRKLKDNVVEVQRGPTTSAALREQIAKAKAVHCDAVRQPAALGMDMPTTFYDFEASKDPFNAAAEDDNELLNKRLDAARRDGSLNIAGMGLRKIPGEVLKMYEPEAMEIASVPWNECIDLTRFVAADNEIGEIGDEVFPDFAKDALTDEGDAKDNQFGGIETLDLHGNLLSRVPLGLRRLERLTHLNLSRNNLDNWAFDVISQIDSLRDLQMGCNDLARELPESIGKLQNLESLDLHGNKLSLLPSSLRELVNLRILKLSENRFSYLPIESLASLPLVEIYASSNALTGALFPSSVVNLPRLQVLEVANNAIASLSFSRELVLPALHHLDVSNNRLSALPDVSTWKSLLTLLAEGNALTHLPEGFTALQHLRNANFGRNDLRGLNTEVARMGALEVLVLLGNPLREKKYLTMPTEDLKSYLAKRSLPPGLVGESGMEGVIMRTR